MIKEPNMSVEKTHFLGAMMKGAILLIFFVFGVATYAQSYNSQVSYRVNGATQSTASAQQWSSYGVSNGAYHMAESDCRQVEGMGYKSYQSTVYKPFSSSLPSGMGSAPSRISGRRNSEDNYEGDVDTDKWGDIETENPGVQGEGSPVGEPFVLLLFAAVAAVVIARRRKQVA